MENLYLIGNGFDKHHDIPSGYGDFYNWLNNHYEDLANKLYELYDYNGDLWSNFEVELGNLDIENKASEIYQEHPADEMSDHYERTFHEGAIVAGDTIGEIYNNIREKFPEWVKQLSAANTAKEISLQEDAFFINFNYTDTLIDLYNISLDFILFIHGRAKVDKWLVLGHGKSEEDIAKEAEKGWNENTHPAYEQTVQAIERQVNMMRKLTEKIILDNKTIFQSFKDVKHIYVFGLSMSEVDKPYFTEIISHIDIDKVTWYVDAHGNTPDEIAKKGAKKVKFLTELGVAEDKISVCSLENLRKYKDNPLF
jgi:hypothetical protein